MTIADYFEQKAEEERQKNIAKGRAEGRAELRSEVIEWDRRRLEAEASGETFDEPIPGGEEDAG